MKKLFFGACLLAIPIFLYFGVFNSSRFGASTPVAQPYTVTTSTAGVAGAGATTTRFFGSALPQVNNLYDLGDPVNAWRNIYASGTSQFQNINIIGSCTGCGASNTNFGNITWVNATGTNTTSTNLFATNILAGNATATAFAATMEMIVTNSGYGFIQNDGTIRTAIGTGASLGQFGTISAHNIGFFTNNNVRVEIDTVSDLFPFTTNVGTLGLPSKRWAGLYTSGVSSTGGLYPTATNSYDLGSPDLSWGNGYVSGTLTTGSVSSGNVSSTNVTSTNTWLNQIFIKASTSSAAIVTQNTPCGWSTIASGASSSTIINSYANGNYFVFLTMQNNPGVVSFNGPYVVTSTGSFAINTSGNVGNATVVAYCINKLY